MFGQYRNSGIRRLFSYDEALRWYKDTPPINGKGRNAGLRPLGHRNKMHFQIRMQGDAVECVCYDTPVVTFHPDGVVAIKDGGFVSQTTAHFIRDVLGIGASVSDKDIVLRVNDGYHRLKTGVKVKKNERGTYEVVDVAPHDLYHIDRRLMKELRKPVAAYRTYLCGLIKLRAGVFEREELITELPYVDGNWSLELSPWREDAAPVQERMKQFIQTVSQEDQDGNWYRASLQLIWSGYAHRSRLWTDPKQELKHLDDLLIATHPEVLLVSHCEPGVFKKNAYARFKKYKELQA